METKLTALLASRTLLEALPVDQVVADATHRVRTLHVHCTHALASAHNPNTKTNKEEGGGGGGGGEEEEEEEEVEEEKEEEEIIISGRH
jgi:hypothetical protein